MIRYEPMAFGLARVLGGVHLAVGLPAAYPRVPLALAAVGGVAAFVASGVYLRKRSLPEQVAWAYGVPLSLCVALLLATAGVSDWENAQAAVVRLLVRTWGGTPLPFYPLAYAVTRRPDPPRKLIQPPR